MHVSGRRSESCARPNCAGTGPRLQKSAGNTPTEQCRALLYALKCFIFAGATCVHFSVSDFLLRVGPCLNPERLDIRSYQPVSHAYGHQHTRPAALDTPAHAPVHCRSHRTPPACLSSVLVSNACCCGPADDLHTQADRTQSLFDTLHSRPHHRHEPTHTTPSHTPTRKHSPPCQIPSHHMIFALLKSISGWAAINFLRISCTPAQHQHTSAGQHSTAQHTHAPCTDCGPALTHT